MSNTYAKIDTRTSNDPNASADINQLQSNFNSFLDSAGNFTKGGGTNHVTFSLAGLPYTGTNIQRFVFATAMNFSNWVLSTNKVLDATLSVDINKNDTSILGATAFEISAGSSTASVSQSVSFAKFDEISWDIDSAGTNTASDNFTMISGV